MDNPQDLKKQLFVEFEGEQGIDEGGVFKKNSSNWSSKRYSTRTSVCSISYFFSQCYFGSRTISPWTIPLNAWSNPKPNPNPKPRPILNLVQGVLSGDNVWGEIDLITSISCLLHNDTWTLEFITSICSANCDCRLFTSRLTKSRCIVTAHAIVIFWSRNHATTQQLLKLR